MDRMKESAGRQLEHDAGGREAPRVMFRKQFKASCEIVCGKSQVPKLNVMLYC